MCKLAPQKPMQPPAELDGIHYWLLAIAMALLITVIALLIGVQTHAIYTMPLLIFALVFLTFTVAFAALLALKTKLQGADIVLVVRR